MTYYPTLHYFYGVEGYVSRLTHTNTRERGIGGEPLRPVDRQPATIQKSLNPLRSSNRQRSLRTHSLLANGDPLRLSQILRNLLDNASKHSHNGCEIRLAVTIAAAGDAMVLSVSDTGIGITAQTVPHLFKPFVQDDHAIAFNGVGGGIVLAAVGAAVEAHGGSVVASSPGNGLGSQFAVTLPLVKLALDAKTHGTSHS